MQYLRSSNDPEALIRRVNTTQHPLGPTIYRSGMEDLFERLPVIDPHKSASNSQEEIEVARKVLKEMALRAGEERKKLDLPQVEKGKFARVILGIEEPKEEQGIIKPGVEVLLALLGEGFTTPVHGHKVGLLHEVLIDGDLDIYTYDKLSTGRPEARFVFHRETVRQDKPGLICSTYTQDVGQLPRSAAIHSFSANRESLSFHYVPEHVRDGVGNRFEIVGKANGEFFPIDATALTRVDVNDVIEATVGDVYLVKSPAVPQYGDHYLLIVGGKVQKPHGIRPEDINLPAGPNSPLTAYPSDELVILKLNTAPREAFYKHYSIDSKYRK